MWLAAVVPEDEEQGLDVNTLDYYGRTPLYKHATLGRDAVKLLFKLGGDIQKPDTYGSTPVVLLNAAAKAPGLAAVAIKSSSRRSFTSWR